MYSECSSRFFHHERTEGYGWAHSQAPWFRNHSLSLFSISILHLHPPTLVLVCFQWDMCGKVAWCVLHDNDYTMMWFSRRYVRYLVSLLLKSQSWKSKIVSNVQMRWGTHYQWNFMVITEHISMLFIVPERWKYPFRACFVRQCNEDVLSFISSSPIIDQR